MNKPFHILLAGWIASLCFMFSGLPAVLEAIKTNQAVINSGTLALWTIGEICAIIYISQRRDLPLLINYTVNLVLISILWFYKIFP